MSLSWDDAVAVALALPGTELATHYGEPAVKVAANGRAFLSRGHEQDTSFALAIDLDTVDLLKESDPATFWQSAHYQGWPAVLVRYDATDAERVRAVIGQAHAWATARPKVRARKKT